MNAIHFAMDLFEGEKVRYILLNVFQRPASGGTILISIEDILERDSMIQLERLRNSLSPRLSREQEMEVLPYFGRVPQGILNVAKNKDAFMIVMGTTGSSGLKDIFFGSVASAVAEKSSVPVLTIPEKTRFKGFEKVVFCSDLRDVNREQSLEPLRYILTRQKSKLTLLSVQEEVDAEERRVSLELSDRFKDLNPSLTILEGENVAKQIEDYLEIEQSNLLVILSREHSGFFEMFKPKLTPHMIKRLSIPALTIPE